ncbi:NAD synthetase [Pseudomonas sp. FW507-12TSA]|uniref:NAD synthetase n=2 Tax=Pseudomonas TaxID=286 RepID=A0ABY9NIK5_9PSED|nr:MULTISPECIES: NAD synthetase [Pseudomonas]POA53362.1 NAD synthetase [Pseudomonas sp. FW507-12TSA]WMN18380.1 NAD synthetase [Pseudomonas piscis]
MASVIDGVTRDLNITQMLARQRIESQLNLPRLFAAIDTDPSIAGAGVVYIDADFNVITLREFRPICSITPKRVVLREAKRYIAPQQFVDQVKNNPRESRLATESFNTSLSCAAAVIGWLVVFSGTVAVPFTAGASAWMVALGVSAAVAGTAQCVIGGARVINEIQDPAANDRMDDAEWYTIVSPILDGISLVGVGGSALTTVKLLKASKAANTGKSWTQLLKGLNRQERARLTKELLTLRDPSLTPKLLKLKQRTEGLTKRYSTTQIRHATLTQMQDALGAVLSTTGSIRSGNLGTAKTLAVGLYEEFDE